MVVSSRSCVGVYRGGVRSGRFRFTELVVRILRGIVFGRGFSFVC